MKYFSNLSESFEVSVFVLCGCFGFWTLLPNCCRSHFTHFCIDGGPFTLEPFKGLSVWNCAPSSSLQLKIFNRFVPLTF